MYDINGHKTIDPINQNIDSIATSAETLANRAIGPDLIQAA